MLSRFLSKKTQMSFKHKPWSAPAILTLILITGMLLVFSFEMLGLTARQEHVTLRQHEITVIPNHVIKQDKEKEVKDKIYKLTPKLMNIKQRTKEENLEAIYDILITSAYEQNRELSENLTREVLERVDEFYDF